MMIGNNNVQLYNEELAVSNTWHTWWQLLPLWTSARTFQICQSFHIGQQLLLLCSYFSIQYCPCPLQIEEICEFVTIGMASDLSLYFPCNPESSKRQEQKIGNNRMKVKYKLEVSWRKVAMLSKVLLGHSVGILHLSTFTLATTVQKSAAGSKIQMSKESLVEYMAFMNLWHSWCFLFASKYSLWQNELIIILWWKKG